MEPNNSLQTDKGTQKPVKASVAFSDDVCDHIITEMAKGRTVTAICADDNDIMPMPHAHSVYRKAKDDGEEKKGSFGWGYARARQIQVERLLDEIMDVERRLLAIKAGEKSQDHYQALDKALQSMHKRLSKLDPRFADKPDTAIFGGITVVNVLPMPGPPPEQPKPIEGKTD